ncbi:MAG: hypothetical protein Q9160_001005 [Pyrenula sp. 1 TL-2023]
MSFQSQLSGPSINIPKFASPQQLSNSRTPQKICVRVNPQWLVDPTSDNPEEHRVLVSVERGEDFPVFISNVVEVMRPLTIETGGVPLRVLRVPVKATKTQKKSLLASDSSRMNVQEITYFTHALDGFLIAEQLEMIWNFSMFARGAILPFLNEVERLDIASLSGQLEIPLTSTFMCLSWTEQHWIKFFDVCVSHLRGSPQGYPSLSFPAQSMKNFNLPSVPLNPFGSLNTTAISETTTEYRDPHSSIAISRPRPATETERANLAVSFPRSYTKLDEPLSTNVVRKLTGSASARYRTEAQAIHKPLHLHARKSNSSLRSLGNRIGAKKIPIASPYGTSYTPKNRRNGKSIQANQLRDHGKAIRPTNVYGRDCGKSIFQRPAIPNRIWVNPKITKSTARTPTDHEDSADMESSKKFTMDPYSSTSILNAENASSLEQPSHQALTYEQRLYTVTHLNTLVHTRGDDIFAILRCYCPELLRQSISSDSINLTSVPDKILRQLYQQVILRGPIHIDALNKAPDLRELSYEDMDFLWEEYPRLGLDEQRELSRMIEATTPNVQYGIVENSIPLVRRLPVTVQHLILKYVKDRKAQFDEVMADAEEHLQECARAEEDEEHQRINRMTNAMLDEQKVTEAQEFEEDIWNDREEALSASQEAVFTVPDLLFGRPRVRRRPGKNSALGHARRHISSMLSLKPGRDTPGRKI